MPSACFITTAAQDGPDRWSKQPGILTSVGELGSKAQATHTGALITKPWCPLLYMSSCFPCSLEIHAHSLCVVHLAQLPEKSLGLLLLAILNVNPEWLVESKGQRQTPWKEDFSNQVVFLLCAALSRLLTAQEDRQRENALQLEDISRRKGCCT